MRVTYMGVSGDAVQLQQNYLAIPLFSDAISAGFPSPAQDYIEQTLDLNELCIKHPAATFFVRVEGDSMINAGIFPNDILVVDRSIQAVQGDIVVASLYGEFTVKELVLGANPCLLPHNPAYLPISIPEGSDMEIFGVVTNVVRNLRNRTTCQP
ncbi:translesion error-prone DNA polymerase V autoproteolytic subunit [Marinospirillum insulare]|uniref:Protein impA n=1 Tax=Marinospirillum insulare TaxID=217169 RepID=A0ABQ5ZZZ5_9GAMM|nr:protein impA' [Marinospirillum insulare]